MTKFLRTDPKITEESNVGTVVLADSTRGGVVEKATDLQSPQNRGRDPLVARDDDTLEGYSDAAQVRATSQRLARRACNAFRDACEAADEDSAEASYLLSRSTLDELWGCAKHRDVPFRDLLAMLTAALKHRELSNFDDGQKNVLRTAFSHLPTWLLEFDVVDDLIDRFADHDIDITGPIAPATQKKFRVIIEEI
jgi:hypothetical protein